MRTFRWLSAILIVLAVLPSGLLAQARGTITGRVLGENQQPLAGVTIQVEGTQLRTQTNAEGRFSIANVPAGRRNVLANLVGYEARSTAVDVGAGQTAAVDLMLSPTVVALDAIVVTGTAGASARREQPAVIASIDVADQVQKGVVTSVRDVLTARVPGVSVVASSGVTGTSQQIRIRGASSISLSNQPLVFIDGVRADARTREPFYIGGQGVSRLFDIDPQDIESIEVVKGPAAATLYGADASAGVIQIITKKGQAGSNRFTQSVSMEYNRIDPNFSGFENFGVCTAAVKAAPTRFPACVDQPVGAVIQDNPLLRENGLRDGNLKSVGYTARGGGENYGYYVSLNYDNEQGIFPNNSLERASGRVNFTFIPHPKLAVEAGFGMYDTYNNLPINDNNIYGFLGVTGLGSPLTVGGVNNGFYAPNRGIEAITSIESELNTLRYTPVVQASYTPAPWFSNRLILGADVSRGQASRLFPRNSTGFFSAQLNRGNVTENRNNFDSYTVDYLGNIESTFGRDDWITSQLSFGFQAISETTDQLVGTGTGLTTNAAREVDAAAEIGASQFFSQENSLGFLAQEQIGFNDRLFVQLGARVDVNSSFGDQADAFFLPKIGASWVVSEEPFFESLANSWIPTLRLRAAYGETGRSPSVGASLRTFDPAPFALETGSGSGVVPFNPGNENLRPERGKEFEAGFEAGLFNERLGLELTYFNKNSTDLLVRRPLPPSAGFVDPLEEGRQNPFVNLGESVNRGLEYAVRANLLNYDSFRWDVRLAGSTLHNELVELGEIDGIPIEPFGTTNRFTPGRQLGAFFSRKIQSVDVDRGVAVVSDTIEFIGNILPTNEGNLGTTFTILRNLQLTGQLDWKRDFTIYNQTAFYRQRFFRNDERVARDSFSPEEKIRRFGKFVNSKGEAVSPNDVNEEFMEDASFMRLREVALTYDLPDNLARNLGARGATITVGGQNLGLWTDYSGFDPEVISNFTDRDAIRNDFFAAPQPRRWVAKLNLSF